ncbi:MAG: DUF4390 domain-containing protein [Solirubrobacteraceae bacterium]|jgi:hypothetical protein|nr:DUF4390 domain-containing protein [Solirubrobacteraceae bacterium]
MLRLVLVLAAALAFAAPGPAHAEEIELKRVSLELTEEGYALDADYLIELNARLDDALHSGVPLWFAVELQVGRPRWYWLDEKVVSRALPLRLSFHALTRQYRVSGGTLHQSYPTLGEALRALGTIRGWVVLERGQLKSGETYDAALRMRLDLTQMPKPFQVTAITNRDWNLASEWRRWRITANGGER